MSDMPQKRQMPFWLMLSVMINLALLGLAAGLLLKRSDHRPPKHADRHGERSLTAHEDYKFVGEVIREAFAAAEPELQARREAGKALGTVVAADPIDMDDVRAKILKMREADEALHDALDAAIVPRLETMTVRQRAVFARTLSRDRSRNLLGRNKGDKRDKWRKKVRRDGMGDMPPPPPPIEVPEFEKD